ncbi:unnamed protein product [Durusdinium trenchii]|uniref:Potassium channel tetramerisation-type BTB domain-containing protein n=1 Tax=Durusdinium trenchii TaxID=1381693 RepID=A0ABP0QES0_9DINO
MEALHGSCASTADGRAVPRTPEVLIWKTRGTHVNAVERPAPELFQPVVPLRSVQCGTGPLGLIAFVTMDHKLYLMEPYGESGGPRLVEPLLEHEILEASSMGQLLVAITTQGAAFEVLNPAGLHERANAGDRKAQALCSSGMVATFGRVQELQLPVSVGRVSCGPKHSLLLSLEGLVFSMGVGPQLGLGELQETRIPAPTNEVSADDPPSELVRFRVDGEHFEILEQTLRAKGDTLLVTLLDDHWRTKTKEICVEGNKERFRYILDWYRYGSILLPWNISVAEMKRDCAFFQLPDDVQIRRESATISDGIGMLADVQKEVEEIRQAAEADIRQAEAKIIAMWIVQTILSQLASTLSTQKSEVEVDLEIGKDIRLGWGERPTGNVSFI